MAPIPPYDVLIFLVVLLSSILGVVVHYAVCVRRRAARHAIDAQETEARLVDNAFDMDRTTSLQPQAFEASQPNASRVYLQLGVKLLVIFVVSWLVTLLVFVLMGVTGVLGMFLFAPQNAEDYEDSWLQENGREVWFASAPELKLVHAWYLRNNSDHPSRPLNIFYSHGSGGNLASSYRIGRYKFLLSQGNVDLLVYDYPGYGKSEGEPTAEGVVECGLGLSLWFADFTDTNNQANTTLRRALPFSTAVTPVTTNLSLAADFSHVTLLGRSMGGAVATYIGAQSTSASGWTVPSLILQSTFSNLEDLAKYYFPMFGWVWSGFAASQFPQYNNLDNLARFDQCLFQSHSHADQWVPFSEAEAIQAAASKAKESCTIFLELDEAKHTQPLTPDEKTVLSRWTAEVRK